MANFDHLSLDERFVNSYPYSTSGGGNVIVKAVNRQTHGNLIKARFNEALADFNEGRAEQDFVFLEFISAIDFELDLVKFESSKNTYRIAYVKKSITKDDVGNEHLMFHCGVYLDQSAISDFLNKVNAYLTEYTPQSIKAEDPRPKFNAFIANIQDIQAATLKSFWQEVEDDFPPQEQEVWWEVWLDNKGLDNIIAYLKAALEPYDIQIGMQWLHFPERSVGLIKGTAEQLSASLLYTDRLAELRKPRETADFFTGMERNEQNEWINNLRARVTNMTDGSDITVCLLDTGVNRSHPLLEDLVPASNLDTIIPEFGVQDGGSGTVGHGTPMLGMIAYGDLSDFLSHQDHIQLYHHLESIKVIQTGDEHDPQNYGYVTQEAMDRALLIRNGQRRIYCLAITSETVKHKGAPTSWSAAIDQYVFGSIESPNEEQLTMVSSGNLPQEEMLNYPLSNWEASIHEPAQAFNAITVGSYTQKDQINPETYPNATPVASRGSMAPSNTTSIPWQKQWPIKPDIVMEGGNYADQNQSIIGPDSLFPLSIAKGTLIQRGLATFGDTSGAVALASRLVAQLYHRYPHLRPETIRALMIHSAEWTQRMLGPGVSIIAQHNIPERIEILRQVGYGVPNLNRASNSAENSLTIIAESEIYPFKWEDSRVKTNEFHLYDLPWPSDILTGLEAASVKLKITLSYFIEPNPGNKTYNTPQNYASHGLRFKMIDPTETHEAFMGRVSMAMREDNYERQGKDSGWQLGPDCRNKGSIHKDIWEGTAADLATRKSIAIHPVGGWWKTRKKLERYNNPVRYSLVISIEAPGVEVDLYNAVANLIDNYVSVEV